jgi:thioredoxin-like negative regulator of GroEL
MMVRDMMKRRGKLWTGMLASILVLAASLALFAGGFCGCSDKQADTAEQPASEDQTVTPNPTGTTAASAAEKALAEAKAASMPVLLNFHSTKCIPCIEIEKVIKEVEPEYAGRAAFIVVDVYDASEQDLCNQYGIQTIPTTVFLDANGQIVKVYTGVIDADSMRGILDGLISGQLL